MDILSGADYKIQKEVESIFNPPEGNYVNLLEEQKAEKRQEVLDFLKEKFPDAEIILDTDDRTKGKEGRTFAESRYNLERPNVPNFIIKKEKDVSSVFGVDPENGAPDDIRRVVGTATNPKVARRLLEESLLRKYDGYLPSDRKKALEILQIKNMREIEDSYRDRAGKPYKAAEKYGKDNFIFFNPSTKRQTVYNIPSSILPTIEMDLSPLVESYGYLWKDFDTKYQKPPSVEATFPWETDPNWWKHVKGDLKSLIPEGMETVGGIIGEAGLALLTKGYSIPARIAAAAGTSAATAAYSRYLTDQLARKYIDANVRSDLSDEEIRDRIGNGILDFSIQLGAGPTIRLMKTLLKSGPRKAGRLLIDTGEEALSESRKVINAASDLRIRLPNIGAIHAKKVFNDSRLILEQFPPGSPFRKKMTKHVRDLEATMDRIIRKNQRPVTDEEIINTWTSIMSGNKEAARALAKDKSQLMFFTGVDELGNWARKTTKSLNEKWQDGINKQYDDVFELFDNLEDIKVREIPNVDLIEKELKELKRQTQSADYDPALAFVTQIRSALGEAGEEGLDIKIARLININKSKEIADQLSSYARGDKVLNNVQSAQLAQVLKALNQDTHDVIHSSSQNLMDVITRNRAARELDIVNERYKKELDAYITGINRKLLNAEDSTTAYNIIDNMIKGKGNVEEITNFFDQLNPEQAEFLRKSIIFRMSRDNPQALDMGTETIAIDSTTSKIPVEKFGFKASRPQDEVQNSANLFVQNYRNMHPKLKTLIFGKEGDKSSRRDTMDQFVGIMRANPEWLRSSDVIGPWANVGQVVGALTLLGTTMATGSVVPVAAGAGIYGALNVISRLMTNDSFMRFIVGVVKQAEKTGGEMSTKVLERNLGRLLTLGARDPEIYQDVQDYFSLISSVYKEKINNKAEEEKSKIPVEAIPEPSPLYLPTKKPVEKKPATSAAALPTAPAPLTGTVDPTRFSQLFPDSGSIVTSEDLLRRQA